MSVVDVDTVTRTEFVSLFVSIAGNIRHFNYREEKIVNNTALFRMRWATMFEIIEKKNLNFIYSSMGKSDGYSTLFNLCVFYDIVPLVKALLEKGHPVIHPVMDQDGTFHSYLDGFTYCKSIEMFQLLREYRNVALCTSSVINKLTAQIKEFYRDAGEDMDEYIDDFMDQALHGRRA